MLYDIDFNKALDSRHTHKECKRIITKKIDMKNRNAYWHEYEYLSDNLSHVLSLPNSPSTGVEREYKREDIRTYSVKIEDARVRQLITWYKRLRVHQ